MASPMRNTKALLISSEFKQISELLLPLNHQKTYGFLIISGGTGGIGVIKQS